MSIRHRLLWWFLLGSLLPIVLIVYFAYHQAYQAMQQTLFHQVQSLADDRVRELASWKSGQQDHVRVLAANPAVQQCARQLGRVMRDAGPLSAEYRRQRDVCRSTLDFSVLDGLDDVLLADRDGRIVYTLRQRLDFGAWLFEGELGGTRLAKEARHAAQRPGTYFVPHHYYPPARRETAFWLSAIVVDGSVAGYFIISLSAESLNRILNSDVGLGRTGEVLLARREADGRALVLGPLRQQPQAAFRLRLKADEARLDPVFDALRGRRGAGLRHDYRGEPVLAAWEPVPGLGWGLVVKIDQQEAMQPLRQLQQQIFLLMLAAAAGVLLLGWWLTKRLLQPLHTLLQVSTRLGNGDIGVRVANTGDDEIGRLGHSFNLMAEQIGEAQKRLWQYACELEAKVAEHTGQLLQRQQQLEDAEQMARLGYYIVDHLGGTVSWSRQLSALLAYPEAFGASEALFRARVHPEDLARVLAVYEDDHVGQYRVNYRLLFGDQVKYVQEMGRHDWQPDGALSRRMAVIQDVSHYVSILEEKTATLQALEQERLARAELAASHAEAKAQAILAAIEDGIIGLSTSGSIVFCNRAAASLLALDVSALEGQLLEQVLHHSGPDGRAYQEPGPLLQALLLRQSCASQWELFGSRQRASFPVVYQLNLLPEGHGDLAAVLYFRDISAQRASEARLEQMSRAVTQSPAGVLITDINGVIEYVNPRLLAMTGYSEAEILGQTPQLFRSGLTSKDTYKGLWQSLRNGISWHGEMLNQRKDGSPLWVMQMISPMRDSAGRLTHFVSVQEDISEQKALAQQMEAAKLAAEAAAATKSAFLANMSHEIRTPMNAIIGMADLALRDALPERTRQFLQKVLSSARGLLDIINDILDFSKIESGHLQVEQTRFELDSVLGSLADMLSMRVEGKPLELVFDVAPQVPPVLVGDPLRLGQVLLNLLGNALKFTREGEIVLSIQPHADGWQFSVHDSGIGMSDEQVGKLFQPFSQADVSTQRRFGGTGLGLVISSELVRLMGGRGIEVVSQPGVGSSFSFVLPLLATDTVVHWPGSRLAAVYLYGLRPSQARVVQQQLAALAIPCHSLVGVEATLPALMQPEAPVLWLIDSDHSGWANVFQDVSWPAGAQCVLLSRRHLSGQEMTRMRPDGMPLAGVWTKPLTPLRLRQGVHRLLEGALASPEHAAKAIDQVLAGCRVMVVDDVALNQEVAGAYLQDAGAEVRYAANGEEALHLLASYRPDVILMDCHMPVMDGFTATTHIRANPDWATIPVVALTANALAGSREEALAAGMDDYVSKPIDPDKLFAVLAQLGITALKSVSATSSQPSLPVSSDAANLQAGSWDRLVALGVVVDEGVARAMHKRKVYLKWLRLFASSQATFGDEAAVALQQGDIARVQLLAHTLKGAASNVSAEAVRQQAEQLESLVRQGATVAEMAAALAATVEALQPVRNAIAALPDA
ncbi:MAG: PAS domain-containing protein [Vogesella sp.]|uniref:PAS domain-containing protein n=1 Tax=Vogesella sp. TaxID=1904252 RepID=UPI00391BDCE7